MNRRTKGVLVEDAARREGVACLPQCEKAAGALPAKFGTHLQPMVRRESQPATLGDLATTVTTVTIVIIVVVIILGQGDRDADNLVL